MSEENPPNQWPPNWLIRAAQAVICYSHYRGSAYEDLEEIDKKWVDSNVPGYVDVIDREYSPNSTDG